MSWTIPLFIVGLMAILFLWEPTWDAIEEHNRRVAQKRRAQRTRDPNLGYTPPPTAHANIALTPPLTAEEKK